MQPCVPMRNTEADVTIGSRWCWPPIHSGDAHVYTVLAIGPCASYEGVDCDSSDDVVLRFDKDGTIWPYTVHQLLRRATLVPPLVPVVF